MQIQSKRVQMTDANAPMLITKTIGVILGLSGIDHAFFEALQGSTPPLGLVIPAIGEAHRYHVRGTEEAFTIIPNYLRSGLLSMAIGSTIVLRSLGLDRDRACHIRIFSGDDKSR